MSLASFAMDLLRLAKFRITLVAVFTGYAAVAVGKNPAGASGSTAEKLYEKLDKTSLWVC